MNLTSKLIKTEKQLNKWHQDANLLIEEKQRNQEALAQKINQLREQAQLVTQNLELKELELDVNQIQKIPDSFYKLIKLKIYQQMLIKYI